MIIKEIVAECPVCYEIVSIPFTNVEIEMDEDYPIMSFKCPACNQLVTGEPVDEDK